MEEDTGVKAPVTRLRRQLSSEPDNSRSPTPSTPTKKRGRLAAKPQLDLIEENDIPGSLNKRTTRKSISRTVETEEKLTPARKSTRVLSNTSLVMDAENEEKLTPGRRSARIRSNTSLVDLVPAADTPRAKRAARRNSLLDSDGEFPLTPTRTRRTRRGSTSSNDIQANANETPVKPAKTKRGKTEDTSNQVPESLLDRNPVAILDETLDNKNITTNKNRIFFQQQLMCEGGDYDSINISVVVERLHLAKLKKVWNNSDKPENNASSKDVVSNIEVIPEEQDTNRKSLTIPATPSPISVRKSPRLQKKSSVSTDKNEDQFSDAISQEHTYENIVVSTGSDQPDGTLNHIEATPQNVKSELSISSPSSNNLEKRHKKKATKANKSTSEIYVNKSEMNRHRTKSWTTMRGDPPSDDLFHSDNETAKKRLREKPNLSSLKELSSKLGTSNDEMGKIQPEVSSKSNNSQKKKSIDNIENPFQDSGGKKSAEINRSLLGSPKHADTGNKGDNDQFEEKKALMNVSLAAKRLFEKDPSMTIQTLEFIEESNADSNITKDAKSGDQCVPVIDYNDSSHEKPMLFAIRTSDEEKPDNRSIEPMDIDETIPENISLTELSSNRSRNSSLSKSQNLESKLNETPNKSKRKSSISSTPAKKLEQSENLDKSTLVISTHHPRSSLSKSQNAESKLNDDSNKSNQKSISSTPSNKVEQSGNVDKSTLVLSELNVSVSSDTNSSGPLTINNNKSKKKTSVSKDLDKSAHNDLLVPETSVTTLLTNEKVAEKPIKKHALSNCLTSTPVQEKDVKKSYLHVNTSVITPITEKDKANKSDSKSKNGTMSESSESNEELSKDRSSMIDDEAMDAGDDYESGDSQAEEERQYEKDHEIIDKGDTLTSDDDDLSTDSEYEKDSFIVSSDEEDGDLLSGSGDDLDMSDNELTITKKSKNKYNNRKTKEQKKASREMYEARHQINAGKDSETQEIKKNNNRSRLDSTLTHSDDNLVPPKKNKRMRLMSDSSFAKPDDEKSKSNLLEKNAAIAESSDDEIRYKTKKSKRLSESLTNNDSVNSEKEVTLNSDISVTLETHDPLTLAIKQEPKTPRKLDISTVSFTDRTEVEQIEVPGNVTMMEANETSDPLQVCLSEKDDDDDESISENEEATNKYDSILESLNNQHKLPIKSRDISLNVHKETKKTTKEPIIEQLNITVTNKTKAQNIDKNKKTENMKNQFKDVEESSSDSIGLKLLFSDDSNDVDTDGDDNVKKTSSEKIIPLKRCEGKTNLHGSINEVTKYHELETNKIKKDKKIKHPQTEPDIVANQEDDSNEIKFFIDTVGTYGDSTNDTPASVDPSSNETNNISETSMVKNKSIGSPFMGGEITNTSLNINSKKNKNRKLEPLLNKDTMIVSSLEVNSKKKGMLDKSLVDEAIDNVSYSNSKNNKYKLIEEYSSLVQEDMVEGASINKSLKKKKNKKTISSMDETMIDECPDEGGTSFLNLDTVDPSSSNTSSKKKNKKKTEASFVEDIADITPLKISKTPKKTDRKNESMEASVETVFQNIETGRSKKKKIVSDLNEISDENKNITKKKRKLIEDPASDNRCEVESIINNHNKKPKLNNSVKVITEEAVAQEMTEEKPKKRRRQRNKNKAKLDSDLSPAVQSEVGLGKKRKERDEDETAKKSKVMKENYLDKIHVPRLPDALLNKLEDRPNKEVLEIKKSAVSAVATTGFSVENTKRRKNKPSDFLEETVCLNEYESPLKKTKTRSVTNKPKILPFIPIASTSDEGFTTNFQVHVLTEPMRFQAKIESSYKTAYLQTTNKMKKRSLDKYKKNKKNLSKF